MAPAMGEGFLTDSPIPPIFIIDGHDVAIFASIEEAQLHLEPIDVKNQQCVAFDAEGRLLRIEVEHGRIKAQLEEKESTHRGDLEAALRQYLRELKDPAGEDQRCDLPYLVQACHKYIYRASTLTDLLTKDWWKRKFLRFFRRATL